jgi:hypothetical protein
MPKQILFLVCQVVLATTFLGIGFWEARVADTHEPIGNDYNDITVVAYYYTVLKCVLNIFSGLATYLEGLAVQHGSPPTTTAYVVVAAAHFLCAIVAAILYIVYLNRIKYVYRMVIFWDIIILSMLIGLAALAKHVSVAKNPNAALIRPVVV